jgi:hypothetical protein
MTGALGIVCLDELAMRQGWSHDSSFKESIKQKTWPTGIATVEPESELLQIRL